MQCRAFQGVFSRLEKWSVGDVKVPMHTTIVQLTWLHGAMYGSSRIDGSVAGDGGRVAGGSLVKQGPICTSKRVPEIADHNCAGQGMEGKVERKEPCMQQEQKQTQAYLHPPSLRIPRTSQPGGVAVLVCCEHPAIREDSTEPLRLTHPLPARCEAQLSEMAALSHTILVLGWRGP